MEQSRIRTRGFSKRTAQKVPSIVLQETPLVYLATIPGRWLLSSKHTTPVWRLDDPVKGFQRVVKEKRARAIAIGVLDQRRTFPNAIVLATDSQSFKFKDNNLYLPPDACFLVVDGQHRLWAQRYSRFDARYACVIHMGLSLVQMARLFLEINDNQKRVPSSLRWDLVRLIRPDEDPVRVETTELIYAMATDESSPLYQRVDLTGEQPEISLKQGSLAPEIRLMISGRLSPLKELDFEAKREVLSNYLSAIKDLDPDGWSTARTPFYKARVLRVLLRLLPEIILGMRKAPIEVTAIEYKRVLERIKPTSLSDDAIRAAQGSAGMREIYNQVKSQIFPGKT
jgi:DGQHR domain-containing protein